MLLARQTPCWCYAFFKRGDRYVTEKGFCERIEHGHGFVRVAADVPGWPFPRMVEVSQKYLTAARAPHVEPEQGDDDERDVREVPVLRPGDDDAERQVRARRRLQKAQAARRGKGPGILPV